jgi:hypothetical protein
MKFGFRRTFFMGSNGPVGKSSPPPALRYISGAPLPRKLQRMPLRSGLYTRVVFTTRYPCDFNLEFVRAYRTFIPLK